MRPQVEADHPGKIVAIDIETGAFEVADRTLTASERLLSRYPEAQVWCVRIGHRGVHRFGFGSRQLSSSDAPFIQGEPLSVRRARDQTDWRTMRSMVRTGPSLTTELAQEHADELARDEACKGFANRANVVQSS